MSVEKQNMSVCVFCVIACDQKIEACDFARNSVTQTIHWPEFEETI